MPEGLSVLAGSAGEFDEDGEPVERSDDRDAHGVTRVLPVEGGEAVKKDDVTESGTVTVCSVVFRRKEGKIFLKVKSSAEWERWLRTIKQVKKRHGAFENPGDYSFYLDGLPMSSDLDVPGNVDRLEGPLFLFDEGRSRWFLNLAVFRLEGIGRGLELSCSGLIPNEDIEAAIRNTTTIVRRIYGSFIRRVSVTVEVRVRGGD